MNAYTNPTEVATELGVDPAKVIAWIKSGELIGVNIAQRVTGRPRWRIRREDFERFLENRASRPAPSAPKRQRKAAANVIEFYR